MIERIIDRRSHDLGGGLTVGRVLPFHARRMVGPYIFFDHLGPVDLAPGMSTFTMGRLPIATASASRRRSAPERSIG